MTTNSVLPFQERQEKGHRAPMVKLLVVLCFSCSRDHSFFTELLFFSTYGVHARALFCFGWICMDPRVCDHVLPDSRFPVAAASPAALLGLLSGAHVAQPLHPQNVGPPCHCSQTRSRSQKASSQPAQEGPAAVLQAAPWRGPRGQSPEPPCQWLAATCQPMRVGASPPDPLDWESLHMTAIE